MSWDNIKQNILTHTHTKKKTRNKENTIELKRNRTVTGMTYQYDPTQ